MGGEGEDLEPLFDYHHVQPSNFVCLDGGAASKESKNIPKSRKGR